MLCIAATLPVITASNERLFSRLEIVKNYLQGDDCLSHLLLMFAEKNLVKHWTTTSLLTILKDETSAVPFFTLSVAIFFSLVMFFLFVNIFDLKDFC